ncbi:MAG: hypothetical protein ACPF80_01215 [Flavobacteriaceae bacterium]
MKFQYHTFTKALLVLTSIFIVFCSSDSDNPEPTPPNPPVDPPPTTTPTTLNEKEDDTPINWPRVRLLLLKTTDVEITEDKVIRLRDVGKYTEMYYAQQLESKGYELPNKIMFARNTDDDILIYSVESDMSSNELDNITGTAVKLAKEKFPHLNDANSIWATAHYKHKGGATGGGSIAGGRMKFSNPPATGAIDFTKHPAETQFHRDIILKAIMHELGHALSLPHTGPLLNDTSHNTLMGPVNKAYEKTVGVEITEEVRISDFSASLIANHPVFKNQPFDQSQLEGKTMRIEKIPGDQSLFTADCGPDGETRIRGKVISNLPFHRVVLRFLYGGGEYWAKAFAVEPDEEGVFEFIVGPEDVNIGNSNQFELMVSFNNGLTRGVDELEKTIPIVGLKKNEYSDVHAFCNH